MCKEILAPRGLLRKDDGGYSPEEVLSKVAPPKTSSKRSDFHGDQIKMFSLRLRVFKKNGLKCKVCGIVGDRFYKERSKYNGEHKHYHLNLYATSGTEDVLMTKDHIIPASKGGKDSLNNLQTMCYYCNLNKGNNSE